MVSVRRPQRLLAPMTAAAVVPLVREMQALCYLPVVPLADLRVTVSKVWATVRVEDRLSHGRMRHSRRPSPTRLGNVSSNALMDKSDWSVRWARWPLPCARCQGI